ncbi:hypothetical protein V6N11_009385 [Hibiscus sabdariffa]|uniref:Ribosomal protein L34 n=1 Tax=Hibiscus sabdariffa TaxID=183260 RepID=A0ABR2NSQ2_9ROSI
MVGPTRFSRFTSQAGSEKGSRLTGPLLAWEATTMAVEIQPQETMATGLIINLPRHQRRSKRSGGRVTIVRRNGREVHGGISSKRRPIIER